MALDGSSAVRRIVGVNAAFLPFDGLAGALFPSMARGLIWNPGVPWVTARAFRDEAAVVRLIAGLGSTIDAEGIRLYHRLVRSTDHIAAALNMMARWDLEGLSRDLPELATPLLLIAGEADRAVPPARQDRVAERVPGTRVMRLPGLGHLAHEEVPERVAEIVLHVAEEMEETGLRSET